MHAGNQDLSRKGRAVVQCDCDTWKAETRTIFEPPNRTIRNCVSAFENVGPNGTLLWKVLGGRAGQSRRVRRTIALGVCRTKSIARLRLREHLERECINSEQLFRQNTAPAVTFRKQADWWIASLPARKRRPVTPATISGRRDALNAWLLPHLAEKLLVNVSNKTVCELARRYRLRSFRQKQLSITWRSLSSSSRQQWMRNPASIVPQSPQRERASSKDYRGRVCA
jgi:hypothetical protein